MQGDINNPRTLTEFRIADTMAGIALKAMRHDDPRRPEALLRKRQTAENLRVFIYRSHQTLSVSGKVLRR